MAVPSAAPRRAKAPAAPRPAPLARPAPPPRPAAAPPPAVPWGRGPVIGAGVVALASFLVYALTVQHSVPVGDSGELIADAYVLGVAHPPGYPLYTMIGYVVSHLPGGSPALWMNLLSGLLDALTVGVVFLTVFRLVVTGGGARARGRLPYVAAAFASLLLAFSSIFWAYSVVAEVFALNNLLAAVLLLLGIEWCRRPERTGLLWAFMFVFGLALCNQLTIVLFVPAFAVLAIRGWTLLPATRGPLRLRPRELGIAAGALVAGLVPLAYLPLAASADPAMNWGDPTTWGRFKDLLLRKDYGTRQLILGGQHGSIGHNLAMMLSNLTTGFVFAGMVVALLGLWWAWRRRRAEGIALFTAFLVAGPLFQAYTNTGYPDALTKGIVARFYILPSIPVAIVAGLGAWWLLERAAPVRVGRPGLVVAVIAGALLVVPVAAAAAHWSDNDQSGNNVAENFAHDLLGPLPQGALILTRGDENLGPVAYVQNAEHYRTDVIALDTELLKRSYYVSRALRTHPGLLIPFASFDGGVHTSLNTLVSANLGRRPVYYVGKQVEKDFGKPFDQSIEGLSRRLLPRGAQPDEYAVLAQSPGRFAALHYPQRSYPESSWETGSFAVNYAYAAFYLAYAIQTHNDAAHVQLAEDMYRTAIRLYPALDQAYKDLGLILHDHGGDPAEIIRVWQRYLQLKPNDPQAPAIRQVLDGLLAQQRSGSSSG